MGMHFERHRGTELLEAGTRPEQMSRPEHQIVLADAKLDHREASRPSAVR